MEIYAIYTKLGNFYVDYSWGLQQFCKDVFEDRMVTIPCFVKGVDTDVLTEDITGIHKLSGMEAQMVNARRKNID